MSLIHESDIKGKSTGSWYPLYTDSLVLDEKQNIRVDEAGNLVARSAILTDEGSRYEPFAGSTLDADWVTHIDAGTSITVANSVCSIISGMTAGEKVSIDLETDFAPLEITYTLTISQRIANQDIYVGFGDNSDPVGSDTMFARFHFYGTDNTLVSCETQSSTDTNGSEGKNTQLTLPLGLTTVQNLQYKIEFDAKEVRFYIGLGIDNMVRVATNFTQTPDPYSVMYQGVRIHNGTTPASSTTVAIDSIQINNINIVDIHGDITGDVNIQQKVAGSVVNSSTANILAAGTFTGASESTLGVAAIQVSLKTDKNCTVYVDQSPDGTNWDIADEYKYYYSKGGQSWTTQAVASYYRVRVTNNATTDTSYLRLQTALCPIVEAIPRSLSEEGNLKVGVYEIEDANGNLVGISPMGEMRVSEHVRLVGVSFGTTFDANFWTKAVQTGNSDATTTNSILTLTTGTPTANGNILVQSTRKARYIPSYPNYYRGQIQCPAITGANLRRWGAYDTTNGFFFEWDGTNLALVCRKGASDANIIYTGSFNGVLGAEYVVDTNNHTYEIIYTNSKAIFSIDGKTLHTFSGSSSTLTNSLVLNVGLQNVNSGGNTVANLMYVRSSTINRIGKLTATPAWKYQAGAVAGLVLKYGPGTLHRIINGDNVGTLILYDAVTATNIINSLDLGQVFGSVEFDLDFYDGLTITTTGAVRVTIVYE